MQDCTPAETTAPFLRIPPSIRRRIYILAGLPEKQNLYLDAPQGAREFKYKQGYRSSHKDSLKHEIDGIRAGLRLVRALLLTCRSLSSEVTAFLYSENTFVTQDPQAVAHLSPAALSNFRNLHVVLHHVKGARRSHTCMTHYPAHGRPLNVRDASSSTYGGDASSSTYGALTSWVETAKLLGQHVQPGQLNLSLICEVADQRLEDGNPSADQVTATLQHLPPLASCSLRLGAWRNKTLHETARLAAEWATVQQVPRPFRYMDLPTEVRLRILEFTDLITPSESLYWNAHQRYRMVWEGRPRQSAGRRCDVSRVGCFCCRVHAAYSPACLCWRDPQALFLVSKAFLADARDVFLRHHHISVGEYWSSTASKDTLPSKMQYPATDYFTDGLLAPAVPLLRSLKISGFEVPRQEDKQLALGTWMRTLQRLRDDGGLDLRFLRLTGEPIPRQENHQELAQENSYSRTLQYIRQDGALDMRFLRVGHTYEDTVDAPTEVQFDILRSIVHERLWPLDAGPKKRLPFGTRYLIVNSWNSTVRTVYRARSLDDPTPPAALELDDPGLPTASRILRAGDADDDGQPWTGEERILPGDWIEEIWVEKVVPVSALRPTQDPDPGYMEYIQEWEAQQAQQAQQAQANQAAG